MRSCDKPEITPTMMAIATKLGRLVTYNEDP